MACCGQRPVKWSSREKVKPVAISKGHTPVACCREPSRPIVNVDATNLVVLCWKCKFNITELCKAAKPPVVTGAYTAITKIICSSCKEVNEIVASGGK